MKGLIQVAVVYGEGADGGYDVVLNPALACRVQTFSLLRDTGASAPLRAEHAALRVLLFDPGYALPDTAQLLIGADRWDVVQGSITPLLGPSGQVASTSCQIMKVV